MKLLEILKNTFKSVVANYQTVLKISSVWFFIVVIDALTGFNSYCVVNSTCGAENNGWLSSFLFSLSGVIIVCSYIRFDMFKTPVKCGQVAFGKKELKFIGFSLLYLLTIVVLSVVCVLIIDFIFTLLNAGSLQLTTFLFIIVPLYFGVVLSRVYVKFAAIAIGDKETTIKQSFALTKGHAGKLFLGQIIIMFPVIILYALLLFVFSSIGSDNFVVKVLFTIFLAFLSFFDSAVKGSYYSQVYKNFVTVIKKEKTAEVAKVVKAEEKAVAKKTPAKKAPAKKAPAKKVAPKKTTKK
ncbi:MAG: hypothetical protein R3Y43_03000 [Alphaproteobacteria bacterium]